MKYEEIINKLKQEASRKNLEGMARFGINTRNTLGVSMPVVRKLGKQIGKDHDLSLRLWQSKIHEARILASIVAEPEKVTKSQMDSWVCDFDSWDVCDQVCMNLFDKTRYAYEQAIKWTKNEKEFTKRAGFALMAALAFHDKNADDKKFIQFFSHIKKAVNDERNFVKKAVNWALRQIGKRNQRLNSLAIKIAEDVLKMKYPSARWIARDALRELQSSAVQKRLQPFGNK